MEPPCPRAGSTCRSYRSCSEGPWGRRSPTGGARTWRSGRSTLTRSTSCRRSTPDSWPGTRVTVAQSQLSSIGTFVRHRSWSTPTRASPRWTRQGPTSVCSTPTSSSSMRRRRTRSCQPASSCRRADFGASCIWRYTCDATSPTSSVLARVCTAPRVCACQTLRGDPPSSTSGRERRRPSECGSALAAASRLRISASRGSAREDYIGPHGLDGWRLSGLSGA